MKLKSPMKYFKKVSRSAVRPHKVFLIWLIMTKGIFVFVVSSGFVLFCFLIFSLKPMSNFNTFVA